MSSTSQNTPQITAQSWLMIGIIGVVWGSTFMGIEIALRGMPPFWLATFRLIIATGVMALLWSRSGFDLVVDPSNKPTVLALTWAGAVSTGVPFLLLNWGLTHVTSGFAGTAMASVPLVVLPLAHFLVAGEQMTPRKVLGVSLGFIGVFLLVGGDAFTSSGASLEAFGRLACVGAAVCYALNNIAIRRFRQINSTALTTIMMGIGALITLPFSIAFEGMPPLPSVHTALAILCLGIISTALMNHLRVLVVRSAGPSFMTLVNYQVPVWAIVLGAVFLGEDLPSALLLALTLILGGVAISQWNSLRALFKRA